MTVSEDLGPPVDIILFLAEAPPKLELVDIDLKSRSPKPSLEGAV